MKDFSICIFNKKYISNLNIVTKFKLTSKNKLVMMTN